MIGAAGCRGVGTGPVFEARLFDRDMELRWLHSDGGLGRAVLVAEDQQLLPAAFDEELPPVDAHATVQQSYLVWGRPGPGGPDGWTCLSAARIGSILVPLAAVGSGRRVRLQAREYVSAEPTHGNAYVADERLLGLESYVPDHAKGVSR